VSWYDFQLISPSQAGTVLSIGYTCARRIGTRYRNALAARW